MLSVSLSSPFCTVASEPVGMTGAKVRATDEQKQKNPSLYPNPYFRYREGKGEVRVQVKECLLFKDLQI